MAELHLMRDGVVVHVRPLADTPLHIGRSPTNDMVLSDPGISSRHAVVWVSEGRVRVEDLGSKNGTFVNGEAAKGQVLLRDGDRLGLGAVVLRVRDDSGLEGVIGGPWLVEDQSTGLRHLIRSDRFLIGSGDDVDLQCEGAPREATLLIHPTGEVWLGTLEREHPLELDTPFEVAGRTLLLREASSGEAPTRTDPRITALYPYRLEVTAAPEPRASVVDLGSGNRHEVTSEHRSALLFVLAQQAERDRAEGRPGDQCGWCEDDRVSVGIWGRRHRDQLPNNLHVLLFRVRKELQDAGFDPWFIEKRKGHTRVRAAEVRVV